MSEFTEALDRLPDLGEEDWDVIRQALVDGSEGECTDEDMGRLYDWVQSTMIDFALLHLIARGHMKIFWDEELEDWKCCLTDTGNREAEKVIVEKFIESLNETVPE